MSKKIKVENITTVHPRYDTRIYRKMAISLALEGNTVYLLVADGLGSCISNDVNIIDIGKPKNRIDRIFNFVGKALRLINSINVDLIHLHDPELLTIASQVNSKIRIIFDSHEDIPADILHKKYINSMLRKSISSSYAMYERKIFPRLDGLIGATEKITEKISKLNSTSVTINNYPIIGEFKNSLKSNNNRDHVIYLGAIDEDRGVLKLVQSISLLKYKNIKLDLCGEFTEDDIFYKAQELDGWKNTIYHGHVTRDKADILFSNAFAGIVNFLETPNHLISLPNKLFEYLNASVPVICSNFDHWKQIIDQYECGIAVDPKNSSDLANAIDYLYNNSLISKKMGENGYLAVNELFNWNVEFKKLKEFYFKIIN
jgi:glycosyltransferase involved in cell wall biosynthesis